MNKAIFLGCAAALLALSTAVAQTYVGLSTGPVNPSLHCGNTLTCQPKEVGIKLSAGYKFGPRYALEGSYIEPRRFEGLRLVPPSTAPYPAGTLMVAGTYVHELAPKLTAVGRLGLSMSTLKLPSPTATLFDSRVTPHIGFGLGYALWPELSFDGVLDLSSRRDYSPDRGRNLLIGVGMSYSF